MASIHSSTSRTFCASCRTGRATATWSWRPNTGARHAVDSDPRSLPRRSPPSRCHRRSARPPRRPHPDDGVIVAAGWLRCRGYQRLQSGGGRGGSGLGAGCRGRQTPAPLHDLTVPGTFNVGSTQRIRTIGATSRSRSWPRVATRPIRIAGSSRCSVRVAATWQRLRASRVRIEDLQ